MIELHLERKPINKKEYVQRTALLSDVSTIIKDDCIIYENGQPLVFYAKIKEDVTNLRWAVKTTKFSTNKRTQGLNQQSRTFGYSPRNALRLDYCYPANIAFEQPKQTLVISGFAKTLMTYYQKYFPEKYEEHLDLVDQKVMTDWKIGDTPFTSGIVNKNNPLKYHYDSGNFKGMLSNMVVLKSDIDGGHLVIPELDLALEVADQTLTIFNGQDILHGVSPINYKNDHAYRYSVVYYSLEQMWKCQTLGEELDRIRKIKTRREEQRLDPEHIEALFKKIKKQVNK